MPGYFWFQVGGAPIDIAALIAQTRALRQNRSTSVCLWLHRTFKKRKGIDVASMLGTGGCSAAVAAGGNAANNAMGMLNSLTGSGGNGSGGNTNSNTLGSSMGMVGK
jgi:hypothetical protein